VQPTIHCTIDSGILISLSNFQNHHCFWSQRIYYITIDVCSYEHGADKILSLSNIQQMSAMQPVYPYVHTLTKSKLTINCKSMSVERYLSKMAVL